jgi:hypothetical protein
MKLGIGLFAFILVVTSAAIFAQQDAHRKPAGDECCATKCDKAKASCADKKDCTTKCGDQKSCGEAKAACSKSSCDEIKASCGGKSHCGQKVKANSGCGVKSECGGESVKSGCGTKSSCGQDVEAKSGCGDKSSCGEAKSGCGDKKSGCSEVKSACGGESVKSGCGSKSACGTCGGDHAEKVWEKGDGKGAVNWLTHHERAIQEARARNKPLLLHFYAAWCGPSRLFSRTTLSDSRVTELLNANFVNAQFDVDSCADLCLKYKLDLIPTVLVFTPSGVLLSRNVELEPTVFLQRMQAVLSTCAQWSELQAQIDKAPANAALHKQVGALLQTMGAVPSAADAYEKAADIMAKDSNLSDDARREIAALWIWVSDTRVSGGAQKDEAPNVDRIADRIEAIDPGGKLGFADNALYLRAVAFGAREDGDKMLEALKTLRATYADSDKTEAAIVWTAWCQLYLKKDKQACLDELTAFVARYPKSDYAEYANNLLKRATRMKID